MAKGYKKYWIANMHYELIKPYRSAVYGKPVTIHGIECFETGSKLTEKRTGLLVRKEWLETQGAFVLEKLKAYPDVMSLPTYEELMKEINHETSDT